MDRAVSEERCIECRAAPQERQRVCSECYEMLLRDAEHEYRRALYEALPEEPLEREET